MFVMLFNEHFWITVLVIQNTLIFVFPKITDLNDGIGNFSQPWHSGWKKTTVAKGKKKNKMFLPNVNKLNKSK